jgi:hypothetical protein
MQNGFIYHSSLCIGREPIAAGMIRIVRGKILGINEESGHYAPNGAVGHVLKRLFDLGLRDLDDCAVGLSRYSPIPSGQRSPLDKRAENLKEVLSAKQPVSDAKSPNFSPALGPRRLKEKTPRQLSGRTQSPLGTSPSNLNDPRTSPDPIKGSEVRPEAGPLAQFKSAFFPAASK